MLWVAGYGGYNKPQTMQLNALNLADPSTGCIALTTQGDTVPVGKLSVLGGYPAPWAIDWDTTNDVGYITPADDDPGYVYRVEAPTSGNMLTQPWTLTRQAIPALPSLSAGLNGGPKLDAVYGHWRYCPSVKAFSFIGNTKTKLALWAP
jgi:hypothetical protein